MITKVNDLSKDKKIQKYEEIIKGLVAHRIEGSEGGMIVDKLPLKKLEDVKVSVEEDKDMYVIRIF